MNYEACNGGSGIDDETGKLATTQKEWDSIMCKNGYSGNLCHTCTTYNNTIYTRTGIAGCATCPSFKKNVFRISILLLILFLALSGMMYVNLKKRTESESSVIIRILSNYIHVITIA